MGLKPKLTFLITQDWYYISHRQELALAAINQGYDVSLITQVDNHEAKINKSGVRLVKINFYRSIKNIFNEIITIKKIYSAYRQLQPDIIHQVSLKPCLYGAVAIFLGACNKTKPKVLNAFTGLGFVFTSETLLAKALRLVLIPIFRMLFLQKRMYVVFQNPSDQETFLKYKIIKKEQCYLIPGSGVNTDVYKDTPEPDGEIVIALVARMLIEKGVYEFVSAAKKIKKENLNTKFVLIGDTDEENPSGIPQKQLRQWQNEAIIEWWGKQEDMASIYNKCHIVVLPSYREGLPKVLLEAAASGRPVITTDVPGCRDAVIHNKTGLLISLKSVTELCNAIKTLVLDKNLRISLGNAGREMMEEKFSSKIINSQFLTIYDLLLSNK